MSEERAREILGDAINADNSIGYGHSIGYMAWTPGDDADRGITLDSEFTIEELEAIVWWMQNKNR